MNESGLIQETLVGVPAGAAVAPRESPAGPHQPYAHASSWDSERRWEAAETDRLNEAHWLYAADETLNTWLAAQLPTLRGRSGYEWKNNPVVMGMIATHADDVVGPDGPTLQVLSDNAAYNEALEATYHDWFRAPTHRSDISGAALLKLWVKSLWKRGRFLGQMFTDPTADGPVAMRIRPIDPRRLGTPADQTSNPRLFMGIEYDPIGRPLWYWIQRQDGIGTGYTPNLSTVYDRIPADLIIDGYVHEEEDQGAGVPWLAASLATAADIRDYDEQVMDAARQMADNAAILYTEADDIPPCEVPGTMKVQRRTIKMAPPRWKPFVYPATMPPVQYPEYRGERHADIGRPASMPRLLVRMDASKHSWASARMDIDGYRRAVAALQSWISGSEKSAGTLNRLVDEVAREARFRVPELRNRPHRVRYQWGWHQMPPVEPDKQASAEQTSLTSRTATLTEILAARKKTVEQHVEELRREQEAFETAGVALPAWMTGQQTQQQGGANSTNTDTSEALHGVAENG